MSSRAQLLYIPVIFHPHHTFIPHSTCLINSDGATQLWRADVAEAASTSPLAAIRAKTGFLGCVFVATRSNGSPRLISLPATGLINFSVWERFTWSDGWWQWVSGVDDARSKTTRSCTIWSVSFSCCVVGWSVDAAWTLWQPHAVEDSVIHAISILCWNREDIFGSCKLRGKTSVGQVYWVVKVDIFRGCLFESLCSV